MKKIFLIALVFVQTVRAQDPHAFLTNQIQPAVFSVSRVMMHDVVNPPAASRYYAYVMMGAYEIMSQQDPKLTPLSAIINHYQAIPVKATNVKYDPEVAAVYCILESGRLLLPSGFLLEEDQSKFISDLQKKKFSKKEIEHSVAIGKDMAAQIVNWTKGDNYGKLSAMLRYTPLKGEGYWYPTPPAYMEAIEPNWKSIRPLVIDSCNEFVPKPPVPFSKDSVSEFYRMAMEVYTVGNKLDEEQLHIASFWDCNPFVVSTSGHMAIGFKKITPGGHWMSIAGIVSKKAGLDFSNTVMVHTLVGVTLMDAFISCWDEKYRSNRIRPETFINRYIDPKWLPVLQTPPFPEYTSGHSVISTAAAEMLTYLLGDRFEFLDDSERMFDIADRKFHSFREAANEAAISRLYGGIHYRDAIEYGQDEGRSLARKIINRVEKAGVQSLAIQNR